MIEKLSNGNILLTADGLKVELSAEVANEIKNLVSTSEPPNPPPPIELPPFGAPSNFNLTQNGNLVVASSNQVQGAAFYEFIFELGEV